MFRLEISMFLINGMKATLRQYNRNTKDDAYDDQDVQEINIKCCPYDISQGIRFGIYSVPEAKGYYQVPRDIDVREGDQIIFIGRGDPTYENEIHTILNVQDNWLFNRIENKIIAVK